MEINDLVIELKDILRREILSFNMIVELLILEEKGLVECDNNLLVHVLEREEDVFSSIACLEKSRVEIINKIAQLVDIDSEMLTVSKISEHVDNPLKQELIETAHVLAQINEDLKQKKITNNVLIKQGAMIVESNIRFILKTFCKDFSGDKTYTSKAHTPKISGNVHVDGRL
ncbi:flagellar export chaperone FlgN [Candidatus Latescibacterota bacterium]